MSETSKVCSRFGQQDFSAASQINYIPPFSCQWYLFVVVCPVRFVLACAWSLICVFPTLWWCFAADKEQIGKGCLLFEELLSELSLTLWAVCFWLLRVLCLSPMIFAFTFTRGRSRKEANEVNICPRQLQTEPLLLTFSRGTGNMRHCYSYNGSDINRHFIYMSCLLCRNQKNLFFFFSLEPYFIGDLCKLCPLKCEKLRVIHQHFEHVPWHK